MRLEKGEDRFYLGWFEAVLGGFTLFSRMLPLDLWGHVCLLWFYRIFMRLVCLIARLFYLV